MFSGVNCPGLIEAPRPCPGAGDDSWFSGVNCPGLIEACDDADRRG